MPISMSKRYMSSIQTWSKLQIDTHEILMTSFQLIIEIIKFVYKLIIINDLRMNIFKHKISTQTKTTYNLFYT